MGNPMSNSSLIKKISLFLASIAPGFFLIGYNIGTGSVTTAASTGAKYGMMFVWPLFLSCVFTFILIVAFGRYTAITGDTALYSFRKYFGSGLAAFVLFSVVFSEWIAFMGVMGVVTEVVKEWSRPLTSSGEGISMVLSSIVFGALIYYLFWNGSHRFFEKILMIFVGLMGISFVMTMFMVITDPMEVIRGLVPQLPQESNAALLIAGMVGTTMGGVLYLVRSILVKEKGWMVNDLKEEKRDAIISSALMFLLSAAIMAAAAGTLYPLGLEVDNAITMVKLLEPLAGRFAISIFVAGIVSAGLSSMFPHLLLAPWFIADFGNRPRDMRKPAFRMIALFTTSLGLVVPIFGMRPVLVMIVSQVLAAVATPVIVLAMLILQNKKGVMGEHKPGMIFNTLVGAILLFTIFMAVIGIIGIKGLF
ncbi:MAG: Nramp family divalent metal transporter [Fidelibacterota bacterium]|nr:MAG: Nramp family divalent metal transporter [Candidatus Neomarinimicrobiota bacterium]